MPIANTNLEEQLTTVTNISQLTAILKSFTIKQLKDNVVEFIQAIKRLLIIKDRLVLNFKNPAMLDACLEVSNMLYAVFDILTSDDWQNERLRRAINPLLWEIDNTILARRKFDELISGLLEAKPDSEDSLFRQSSPNNPHKPFISVLVYDPKHLKTKLEQLPLTIRKNLIKRAFINLPQPPNPKREILLTHLNNICILLSYFNPIERALILEDLATPMTFFSNPKMDLKSDAINFEHFIKLITPCIPYYKFGIASLIASWPIRFVCEFLAYADDPEYLSLFLAYKADIAFNDQHIRAITNCLSKPLNQRQFLTFMNFITTIRNQSDLCESLCNAIMRSPAAFAQVTRHDLLEIQQNGRSISRIGRFAIAKGINDELVLPNPPTSITIPIVFNHDTKFEQVTTAAGWVYLKSLNRTLLFVDPRNPQKMRALKFRKHDEMPFVLDDEFKTLKYLHDKKNSYSLQSKLPIPVGIFKITELPLDLMPENISMLSGSYYCYIYDASPEQFIYLGDPQLTDAEFHSSLKIAIHDLIKLLLEDQLVFHQLIDLFHNDDKSRMDGGIYNPLFDLTGQTQGKLMAWMEGCQYPNVRKAGLADFGDCKTLANPNELFQYLACYLLAFELIICYRARQQYDATIDIEKKSEIWQQAARTIIGIYNYVLERLHLADMHIHASNLVDAERLQNQLQYWLTLEYVHDFEQGRFRRWIYDDTETVINDGKNTCPTEDHIPSWNSLVGFTSFRNPKPTQQDIGPFAGPFPILELTKLRVSTIFFTSNNFGKKSQIDAIMKHDLANVIASSRLKPS